MNRRLLTFETVISASMHIPHEHIELGDLFGAIYSREQTLKQARKAIRRRFVLPSFQLLMEIGVFSAFC